VPHRDHERPTTDARHPIGVVSARTGLPQDVLRAWERRYDAVIPQRTETGRRLYTDGDLDKLRLLKRAVESGRRISDVANLSINELQDLVQEDAAESVPAAGSRKPATGRRAAARYVEAGLTAVEELDGEELDRVLREASVDLSPPSLRNDVIRPLLETIGERWRDGSLRVANEHLATAVIRSFLGTIRQNGPVSPGDRTAVVTTLAGQQHELGALLAAAAVLEVGWNVVYLGPDLPAAEIAAAARQREARAVALSMVYPAKDPRVGEELRELRRLLGDSVVLFVGGPAAKSYDAVLGQIGAHYVEDTQVLQTALDAA
jgi:DNA-binding transcriptional MerR regulator/methylmalonyl-CoA mutase cobalamin-binding subunit